jgi:hypothetical protein
MATPGATRLYELLPAVYREQDAENGYPLRGLTSILGTQLDLMEQDVAQLWSDLFIETCRDWLIPYIGDLVSNNLLYDGGRGSTSANELFTDLTGRDLRPPVAIRTRADVAKTIYYRRRKGALPMLEELARDVTGWPAHAAEFFELLGWTQYLEHNRPQACWFDVRSHERDERVDGAFDEASHTVDVAPISTFDGWHSIKNIGFFCWRLVPNRLLVDARQAAAPWTLSFSPLGNAAPLFTHPRREADETGLSTELHVPGPIRRAYFGQDIRRHQTVPPSDFSDLYGLPSDPGLPAPVPVLAEDASVFVLVGQTPVLPADIRCRRLDAWPAARPAGSVVWVDVQLGRLVLGAAVDEIQPVRVFMTFGFPAALGGGAYERRAWLAKRDPAVQEYIVRTGAAAPQFATVTAALSRWQTDGRPTATIRILDSLTYTLPAGITLSSLRRLTIEAANGERPLLRTRTAGFEIDADAVPPPDPELRGGLTLGGLLIEGFLHVVGDVGRLRLLHTTVVPGRGLKEDGSAKSADPGIVIEPTLGSGALINARLRLQLAFSVCGPIECPDHAEGLWLLDTIVDGLGGSAIADRANSHSCPLHIERTTLLGRVKARELDASESIFTGRIDTARTQAGCVRFSFVPLGSRTPRRYRCQPDLGIRSAIWEAQEADPGLTTAEKDAIRLFVAGWLAPSFVTTAYGRPPYCQLSASCPKEIRTGAEDGSEMGVYCHLKQPQRESNLRIRLGEYLPFGLDAGLIHVT